MKSNLKIWHFLLLLWLAVIFFRFILLINIYELLFLWVKLLFIKPEAALVQLNFALADVFISGKLFILLTVVFLFFRKKIDFLNARLTFASFILISLTASFLFAPLLTGRNPDFYKNIGMTKLLPPLSSVKGLHFNIKKMQPDSDLEKFYNLRDYVVKKSFDENIQYIDSIHMGESITYYQNGIPNDTAKENLAYDNDEPVITDQLFLLGTDQFGRDIFTRLVYGARISLLVGLGSVLIALILGLVFGFLAGFKGGVFDIIFSRITDMFLSFPIIFLVVLFLALFGNSLSAVIIVLGFAGWMSLFKIVKTETLSIKEKNYFISARLLGLNNRQLLIKEVLPVIIVPVVVNVIFQFGNVIIAESALSYLGLGLGENYPSWGSMIQSGQEYLSSAWWMIFFPGIALIFTLLSANSFGILIRRKLNPRLQND